MTARSTALSAAYAVSAFLLCARAWADPAPRGPIQPPSRQQAPASKPASPPYGPSPFTLHPEARPLPPPPPPPNRECMEFNRRFGVSSYEAEPHCINLLPYEVNALNSPEYSACVLTTWFKLYTWGESVDECMDPQWLSRFKAPLFSECARRINALGFSTPVTCSTDPNQTRALLNRLGDPAQQACISRGAASAFGHYLSHDRINAGRRDVESSAEERILDDCELPDAPRQAPGLLKLIGDLHLHSSQSLKNKLDGYNKRVGGLSGLAYNPESNQFLSVTDDKQDPWVIAFGLDIDPARHRKIEFKPLKLIRMSRDSGYGGGYGSSWFNDQDWEDIALLPNGDILLSSEVDQADHYFEKESPRLLSRYSRYGDWRQSYAISDELRTTYAPVVVPPAPPKKPAPATRGSSMPNDGPKTPTSLSFYVNPATKAEGDGATDSDSGSGQAFEPYMYTPPPPQKVIGGMQHNRGIEAMALSRDGTKAYTVNEAPLIQELQRGKPRSVRIFEHEVDPGVFTPSISEARSFYWYELEDEPDNGVSAITALDDGTLLTLERSYDQSQDKLVVRIFRVRLQPARGTTGAIAQKTLVLDLDTIIPQLSPGFRKLENFEGMTVGPRLPSGNLSLVLVSDNNFNANQRTTFLVFEIQR
jgi:hypothetical protein